MSCPILIHQFLSHLIGSNDRCPRLLNEDCNKQIRLSRAPEVHPSIVFLLVITVAELLLLTTLRSKHTFQFLKVAGSKESAPIIVWRQEFTTLVDALYREFVCSQTRPNNYSDIIYFHLYKFSNSLLHFRFSIVPFHSIYVHLRNHVERSNSFFPFYGDAMVFGFLHFVSRMDILGIFQFHIRSRSVYGRGRPFIFEISAQRY